MRLVWLDLLKGIAIVLVVFYHLLFDLDNFVGLSIDTSAWYWAFAALPVLAIFIGGAGISFVFSSAGRSHWAFISKTLKSTGYLLIGAGAITVITWYLFPEETILFGVLHLIAVSRLISIAFVGRPLTALFVGSITLLLTPAIAGIPVSTRLFVPFGCVPDNFSSLDYFPLFPWFGIFCIGIFFGHLLLKYKRQDQIFPRVSTNYFTRACAFLGRHTLIIYLVHQPIIIAILWLFGLMRL